MSLELKEADFAARYKAYLRILAQIEIEFERLFPYFMDR